MGKKDSVLILGAGPAGLSCGYELKKSNIDTTLIEKRNVVGGLSRTLSFGNFKTDIGPHRFFSQNQHLYRMIEDLLGEHWIEVNRITRFYVNGKFYYYPIKIINALKNVGPFGSLRILRDYKYEKLRKLVAPRKINSFEDHIVSGFGRSLAELNMLNYTEKIWGIPCSEISADWATQRIKGLSLSSVLKKALLKSAKGPKSMVDVFYYPDLGTGMIFNAMADAIKEKSGTIVTETVPTKIIYENGNITAVKIESNGKKKTLNPSHVVSSIPITELLDLFDPAIPEDVIDHVKQLRFRSHVSLFITINKKMIFSDQWIYFPDKDIPFGRIMEPNNFSKKMSPEGKSSLLIEFFCWKDDEIWKSSKEELLELALPQLEALDFIKRDNVIETFVFKEKYAYPVYDIYYGEHLTAVKEFLETIRNLQLVGRAGRFRYNNQDHAIEMGILAARNIIEGNKYDIDSIGTENAYFERGDIKSQ